MTSKATVYVLTHDDMEAIYVDKVRHYFGPALRSDEFLSVVKDLGKFTLLHADMDCVWDEDPLDWALLDARFKHLYADFYAGLSSVERQSLDDELKVV